MRDKHNMHSPPHIHITMVEAKEPSFSTPKLPFNLLDKAKAAAAAADSPQHPSGISTPPLQTPASVPFKWEVEPGKPRLCNRITPPPEPSKCLELPPACRMLFMDRDAPNKFTKTPSPTTVLDGPHNVGRPRFSSFRFFREGQDSLYNPDSESSAPAFLFGSIKGGTGGQKARGFFDKLRGGKKVVDGGTVSELSTTSSEERCRRVDVGRKMGRHGSFSGVPHPKSSHIWVRM